MVKNKFRNERDLEISLENDASLGDWDSRRVFDFGDRRAKELAKEYFGTVQSREDENYKRLVKQFIEELYQKDEDGEGPD